MNEREPAARSSTSASSPSSGDGRIAFAPAARLPSGFASSPAVNVETLSASAASVRGSWTWRRSASSVISSRDTMRPMLTARPRRSFGMMPGVKGSRIPSTRTARSGRKSMRMAMSLVIQPIAAPTTGGTIHRRRTASQGGLIAAGLPLRPRPRANRPG